MAKTLKKKMKLEDLARMVQAGFEETASKGDIRLVSEKVDRLEHRMDALETKISTVAGTWHKEIEKTHEWLKELDSRINKLEDLVIVKKK